MRRTRARSLLFSLIVCPMRVYREGGYLMSMADERSRFGSTAGVLTRSRGLRRLGWLRLREVRAAPHLFPSVHLLDDRVDLLARAPQRVGPQEKMDRRLFTLHQLKDRLRGSI